MVGYVIRLEEAKQGQDTATMEWGGQTFCATTRHGATMAVARASCDAGAPDGPWEGVSARDGQKRLYGPSLHVLAGLTIKETDTEGPRLVRWKPHPRTAAS